MTALVEKPLRYVTALTANGYKEDPRVKELQKGYKLVPKGTMRTLLEQRNVRLHLFIFIILLLHATVAVAFSARYFELSALAATAIITTFTVSCLTLFLYVPVRKMLTSSDSPLALNKQRRSEINKARSLAKQLGDSVVPVLTEDHLNSIMNVHTILLAAREDAGKEQVQSTEDYERIAVLLLKDIERKPVLLNLIQNRGLHTMDDLEAALRGVESDTIGPVQSGWL